MTSAPSPWRPCKALPRQSSATSPVRFVANEARCGRSGHMASIDIDFLLVCAQRAPFISRLRQHLMMQLRRADDPICPQLARITIGFRLEVDLRAGSPFEPPSPILAISASAGTPDPYEEK